MTADTDREARLEEMEERLAFAGTTTTGRAYYVCRDCGDVGDIGTVEHREDCPYRRWRDRLKAKLEGEDG